MATLQDVLDRARYYLQDTLTPYRQEDDELELYLADGFTALFNARPDAFTFTDCTAPIPTWSALSDPFPLSAQWIPAVAYIVAGNALLKDDEHVDTGKANYMLMLGHRMMNSE